MSDQAEKLRKQVLRANMQPAKTIAVISGKGGVGKSNFSLNFAITLSQRGYKVLIFDLDIGMGNIDLLAGISAKNTIADFFTDRVSLTDIVEEGPSGISFIAGGSGLNDFVKFKKDDVENFMTGLNQLIYRYDYVIFDIGAGMNEETVKFLQAIDQIFVIVTPEPTSIMDAYSSIKYIYLQISPSNIFLIGNRMKNYQEYSSSLERIQNAMIHFLDEKADLLGYIPDDSNVGQAVKAQIPFTLYKPHSPAAKKMRELVTDYLELYGKTDIPKGHTRNLLSQLKSYFFRI